MNATKVFLGCRISPLARKLIDLERKATKSKSDGEAVTQLIYRASISDAATDLILQEASKDPQLAALIPAIRKTK